MHCCLRRGVFVSTCFKLWHLQKMKNIISFSRTAFHCHPLESIDQASFVHCVICLIADFMGRPHSLFTGGIQFRTRLFGDLGFPQGVASWRGCLSAAKAKATKPSTRTAATVLVWGYFTTAPKGVAVFPCFWPMVLCPLPATVSDQGGSYAPFDSRLKNRVQNNFVPAWGMVRLSGYVWLVSGT